MAAVNPNGLVIVGDGETPRIFSAAVALDVLAGEFVYVSGTQNNLTSGADSFTTADITVKPAVNPLQVNGMSLGSVTSGTSQYVAVLRRGDVIARVIGSQTGGKLVEWVSGTTPGIRSIISGIYAVADIGSMGWMGGAIGRGLTDATSGTNNYTLISLNI